VSVQPFATTQFRLPSPLPTPQACCKSIHVSAAVI